MASPRDGGAARGRSRSPPRGYRSSRSPPRRGRGGARSRSRSPRRYTSERRSRSRSRSPPRRAYGRSRSRSRSPPRRPDGRERERERDYDRRGYDRGAQPREYRSRWHEPREPRKQRWDDAPQPPQAHLEAAARAAAQFASRLPPEDEQRRGPPPPPQGQPRSYGGGYGGPQRDMRGRPPPHWQGQGGRGGGRPRHPAQLGDVSDDDIPAGDYSEYRRLKREKIMKRYSMWAVTPSRSPSPEKKARTKETPEPAPGGRDDGKEKDTSARSGSTAGTSSGYDSESSEDSYERSRRRRHERRRRERRERERRRRRKRRRSPSRSGDSSSSDSGSDSGSGRSDGDSPGRKGEDAQEPGGAEAAQKLAQPGQTDGVAAGAAQLPAAAAGGGDESSDDSDMVGPMPMAKVELPAAAAAAAADQVDYGKALRPGEGTAMAAYVQSGERIPRRGEIGLTANEIKDYEDVGYVMSGSRHQRMNAVRIRKENQVYSAEEQRALALINFEEKQKREAKVLEDLKRLVDRTMPGAGGT